MLTCVLVCVVKGWGAKMRTVLPYAAAIWEVRVIVVKCECASLTFPESLQQSTHVTCCCRCCAVSILLVGNVLRMTCTRWKSAANTTTSQPTAQACTHEKVKCGFSEKLPWNWCLQHCRRRTRYGHCSTRQWQLVEHSFSPSFRFTHSHTFHGYFVSFHSANISWKIVENKIIRAKLEHGSCERRNKNREGAKKVLDRDIIFGVDHKKLQHKSKERWQKN